MYKVVVGIVNSRFSKYKNRDWSCGSLEALISGKKVDRKKETDDLYKISFYLGINHIDSGVFHSILKGDINTLIIL